MECFGFCDFTTQESISCFGSGIQPRIVLGIGQVFIRLCFDAVCSLIPAIHPLLCPVKFPYYLFVFGSQFMLEMRCQVFAGFAIPQHPVTIQCFLFRLRNEKSAAAMAKTNPGFLRQEVHQQEFQIVCLCPEMILGCNRAVIADNLRDGHFLQECKFAQVNLFSLRQQRQDMVQYRGDDCSSKSEFIEKAVRFYIGYLTAEDKSNYLPNMFLSNMRAIASESDNRMSRMLFKLTVELAMIMNLMAANYDIDPETLERLRGSCVREVKRLGGSFSMEDAVEWQNG